MPLNLKTNEALFEVPSDYAIGNMFNHEGKTYKVIETDGKTSDGSPPRLFPGSYFNVPKAPAVDYKKTYTRLAIVERMFFGSEK